MEGVPAFEDVAAEFDEVPEDVEEVPEDETLIGFVEESGSFTTGTVLFLESRTEVRTAAATITATRTDDEMMTNVRFSSSFFIIFHPLNC